MTQHKASLLVVDDDSLIVATLSLDLRSAGFDVTEARSGEDAIMLCSRQKFDLILLDINMPGISGIETAKIITKSYSLPFLFLSAYDDNNTVKEAIQSGALGYIVKPVSATQIVPAIEVALSRASEIQSLLKHQENLNIALSQNRETSVAIGIFMSHSSLSPEQAESALRLYCRNTQQKMNNVAKEIIKLSEELNTLLNAIKLQVGDMTKLN